MKKFLVLFLIFAPACFAQSVTPLVSECSKNCKGTVTVSNTTTLPMFATLQGQSWRLSVNGKTILLPLAAGTTVNLSEMSARIPPRGEHSFDFHVTCETAPCQVAIVSAMTGQHTPSGLAVRIVVPSVVYICDKAKGCRAAIRKSAGLPD